MKQNLYLIAVNDKPLQIEIDSAGKKIDFGNYIHPIPKQDINGEISGNWNIDSTKAYTLKMPGYNNPFRVASYGTLSCHSFVNLDKGILYSGLNNFLVDAETNQPIKPPKISFRIL